MPEDLNVEIAQTLASPERRRGATAGDERWHQTIEIVEAALIAVVAVATAWGGYQAARWDGRQAELYADSSTIRNQADQSLTLGGQQRLLDVSTFKYVDRGAERGPRRPRSAVRAPVQPGVQVRLRGVDRARPALEPRRPVRASYRST